MPLLCSSLISTLVNSLCPLSYLVPSLHPLPILSPLLSEIYAWVLLITYLLWVCALYAYLVLYG